MTGRTIGGELKERLFHVGERAGRLCEHKQFWGRILLLTKKYYITILSN